jgi:hypothetical protein
MCTKGIESVECLSNSLKGMYTGLLKTASRPYACKEIFRNSPVTALCGAAHVPFCVIHDVIVGCEGQLGVESQKVEDPEV